MKHNKSSASVKADFTHADVMCVLWRNCNEQVAVRPLLAGNYYLVSPKLCSRKCCVTADEVKIHQLFIMKLIYKDECNVFKVFLIMFLFSLFR